VENSSSNFLNKNKSVERLKKKTPNQICFSDLYTEDCSKDMDIDGASMQQHK